MEGTKIEDHPGLEGAVEELLVELNREVDDANELTETVIVRAAMEATTYLARLRM